MAQQTVELKIPESITYENVEWVFQFDDDEPKVFNSPLGDTKKLVIEINNTSTSNIWFFDGSSGKTFKIFAREKQ
jgi:prepilin-type processing-associated H-X9-DG protein